MQPTNLALLAPDTLFHGRYLVVRSIKTGGMGAVYEVEDQNTKRPRALKVMLPAALEKTDLRARFAQEARITGRVESDHIVQVSDAGIDAGSGMLFLVMDLLRGDELGELSARDGPLLPDAVVLYLQQVALALDKTHAAGIVHRDLKPENLFLTRRDDGSPCVKILDFGVAKLAVQNSLAGRTAVVGTPLYMAPEQIRGDGLVDLRADLYALGHIAYTLLTGGAYWSPEAKVSGSIFTFFQKILAGPPEAASVRAARQNATLPQAFDEWFARATALEASQRFERATIAVARLREALPAAGGRTRQRAAVQEGAASPPQKQGRPPGAIDPYHDTEPAVRAVPVQTLAPPTNQSEERAANNKPGPRVSTIGGLLVIHAAKHPLLVGRLFNLGFSTVYVQRDKDDSIAFSHAPATDAFAHFVRRAGRWFFESSGSHDLLNGKRVGGEALVKGGDQLSIRRIEFKFIDNGDELRHHEEQYKLTWYDGLTQTFNRRYLKQALVEAYRHAGEVGQDLSVVMLDMKLLQRAESTLGEEETDPLIKQLARIARSHVSNGGILARLNSNTFVLLLPGMRPTDVATLAKKLAQEAREGLGSFPQAVRVKVRVGAAHRLPSDKHGSDLLERASLALDGARVADATTGTEPAMGSTWGFFEELSGELACASAELRKQSERIRRNADLALAALGGSPDRDGVTDAPPGPVLPGTRARLREFKFLEGIWKDKATIQLKIGDLFDGPSDIIVLPCSTDGAITSFVRSRLARYNIPHPSPGMRLGNIEVLPLDGGEHIAQYVAYAASVDEFASTEEAIRRIGEHLGQETVRQETIRLVSAPLLGTGAGGLSSESVLRALSTGFRARAHGDAVLAIHVLDQGEFEHLSALGRQLTRAR